MLVGPGGAPAVRLDDLEDRIHAQILVGVDRLAGVVGIARQVIRTQPAATVELGEVDVSAFIELDDRADRLRARSAARAHIRVAGGLRRQCAIPRDVVPESRSDR